VTSRPIDIRLPPHRRPSSDIWIYAAAGVAYVLAGVYVGRTGSVMPLVALGGCAAIAVAVVRPAYALVAGLAAMALPYTWGPNVPKLGFGMGILVGLLLVTASIPTLTKFRPGALDYAVLAFALSPAAIAAWQGQAFHVTNWIAPAIVLPYFGFRLLLRSDDAYRVFAPAMIAIGVVVSLIAIWEGLSGHNPVVGPGSKMFMSNGHFIVQWNVPEFRNGYLRALSTFGDSIALGMFLLIPLAFALARRGRWAPVPVGIILAALVLTYSRGPWVGAILVLVLLMRRGRKRALAAGAAIIAAALFLPPVHSILLESSSSSTEPGQNTYYRLGLLTHAFDQMSALGHPFADLQSAIPNYPDVTSLLASTMIQTGIVGLGELVLLVALATWALLEARAGADRDRYAGAVALMAQLFGLVSVALITNFQFFFWALLAYVATRRRRGVGSLPSTIQGSDKTAPWQSTTSAQTRSYPPVA
jgi:hypothetical protein